MFALGQSRYSIRLGLVALQHCEVVSHHQKIGFLQLAFGGFLKSALDFAKAVEEKVAGRQVVVRKEKAGIGRECFLGRFDRSFKSARPMSGKAR